jgi:malonyl CoA-acyl carrier protein transacylase
VQRCESSDYGGVFVANAIRYADVRALKGVRADVLLGHSLGEMNALLGASVFDFEAGLTIVRKRAQLMARLGRAGTMAVIRGDAEKIATIVRERGGDLYVACENSLRQVAVAGSHEAIVALEATIAERKLGHMVRLPVSGPFHSPLMQDARDAFATFLEGQPLSPPRIPVVANVTARPYRPDELAVLMADQLVSPVRWVQSVQYLLRQGSLLYEEVGAGQPLSALVREIANQFEPEPGTVAA